MQACPALVFKEGLDEKIWDRIGRQLDFLDALRLRRLVECSLNIGCAFVAGRVKQGLYPPGVYSEATQGYGGDVTITITLDERKATEITISGIKETRSAGGKAIEKLACAILEAQSADVDAVTGATLTLDAIKSAVQSRISQAAVQVEK
ncbi:MAG: FMN-binding protein [Clostridiales bacterium]|jgi:fumarate reductase flavoprotein subunit|nr:FMN-binding protein [Clostridiales bacterium]